MFALLSSACVLLFVHASSLSSTEATSSNKVVGRVALRAGEANEALLEKYLAGLKVMLNGGERTTWTQLDGSFSFSDVQPGTHLLEIETRDVVFSNVGVHTSCCCRRRTRRR